jgi:hypothetical protein
MKLDPWRRAKAEEGAEVSGAAAAAVIEANVAGAAADANDGRVFPLLVRALDS